MPCDARRSEAATSAIGPSGGGDCGGRARCRWPRLRRCHLDDRHDGSPVRWVEPLGGHPGPLGDSRVIGICAVFNENAYNPYAERDYLRAMAALGGPGPYKSGDVSRNLGKKTTQTGPTRDSLIKRGLCYAPRHGELAFTVPMFDEFIRRALT